MCSSDLPFPDRAIMKTPDSWPHSNTGQGLIEVLDMGAIVQRNSEGPGSQHAYRVLSEARLEDEHLLAIFGGMSPSWVGRHEVCLPLVREFTQADDAYRSRLHIQI